MCLSMYVGGTVEAHDNRTLEGQTATPLRPESPKASAMEVPLRSHRSLLLEQFVFLS